MFYPVGIFEALRGKIAPARPKISHIPEDDLFHMPGQQCRSLVDGAMRKHTGFGTEAAFNVGSERLQIRNEGLIQIVWPAQPRRRPHDSSTCGR